MFVDLEELLYICKDDTETKKIMLKVLCENGEIKEFPMCSGHYIIDGIWYAEVNENGQYPLDNDSFIGEMETECLNYPNDWGDLYTAPMEHLQSCELRFTNDLCNIEEGEDKYEITRIKNEDKIYVCLRERA